MERADFWLEDLSKRTVHNEPGAEHLRKVLTYRLEKTF